MLPLFRRGREAHGPHSLAAPAHCQSLTIAVARHRRAEPLASFLPLTLGALPMRTKILALLLASTTLASCSNDAQVASYNLSQAADNFQINRRIVFYNGITGEYLLEIEGLCSQEPEAKKLAVTCKVAEGQYKKHFLGLSDNVT